MSKIMIVEDEIIVSEDIRMILSGNGHEIVAVVAYAEDAIVLAGKKEPDLVLMDIKLAGKMNGIEAAYRIKKERNIPIIFMTANADEGTYRGIQSVNPSGYLLKPFNTNDLFDSIKYALNEL